MKSNTKRKKKTSLSDRIFVICNVVFMIAFVIITLYPVINTLAISLNDGMDALRVDQLTGVFDELSKAKLIDRNVDVYTNAPLIGFLYGRTADLDDLKNPETGQVYNQNVMGDRVIYSGDELQYNFWLIMLLDANYEPNP